VTTKSELFDIRSEMWRQAFSHALPYDAYVATGSPNYQERWHASSQRIALSEEQKNVLASFKRKLNVLVLSGMWCGDCARQCPMIAAIGKAAPCVDVRFLDNQSDEKLRDELRIHGAARVPATIILSEDMLEIARGFDRGLSTYRRKARTELGAACDAGLVAQPEEELRQELQEWVDLFERAHLLVRVSPFLRTRHGD